MNSQPTNKYDDETIHSLAEFLFRAVAEDAVEYISDFAIWHDTQTRTNHSEVFVPYAKLPAILRDKSNQDVVRQVIAYLNDLGIICKYVDTAGQGKKKGFHLMMPPELTGKSWDQIRGKKNG